MKMIPVLVKRDFTSRVKSTSYIVTTILGALVFVGLTFAPPLIQYLETSLFSSGNLNILVLEQSNEEYFLRYLEEISAKQEDLHWQAAAGMDEREAFRYVLDQGLTGLLLVDPPFYTLVTDDGSNLAVNSRVEDFINRALTRVNAERLGLSEEDIENLFQRAELKVREIGAGIEEGETLSQGDQTQSMVLAYFLLFMIYMALIMYGNMIASGVAEEKSSRIMEVMLATVKPLELMLGKIIGVGALGLLQFSIWMGVAVLMSVLGKMGILSGLTGVGVSLGSIPLNGVLWFGLFFLLGFFFYASIFAAAGAIVSRVEDVSQVVTIIMMVIIAGFFGAYLSFLNPNGAFAVAMSLIPFTSPMVMFARIVLANPPGVQIVASVLVLLASILVAAWVSSKIYHLGVLLYGKRPNLRQIVRLLRQAD